MPTLTGPVVRSLHAAYAHDRIEEVIRAVVEDALSPSRVDDPPWHGTTFEDDLRAAITEITELTDRMLAQRLTDLLEGAPPRLAGRMASSRRFPDLS
jgi:hypothetical protein